MPADDSLPDHVIVAVLRREALLTKAKLHQLLFEHITQVLTQQAAARMACAGNAWPLPDSGCSRVDRAVRFQPESRTCSLQIAARICFQ
jgi:hypothetical protein